MTDTFSWVPTSQSTGTAIGRVDRAQFGDGYSQASASGLNPWSKTYQVNFRGIEAELQPIVEFIEAHLGLSFFWKPRFGAVGLYQCDGYSDGASEGEMLSISATFQQTFQP